VGLGTARKAAGSSRACGLLLALLLGSLVSTLPARAAEVAVRFPEGTLRGFLTLTTASGARIADGQILQVVKGSSIETRLSFRFTDRSVLEETVLFSQSGTFRLLHYDQVQRGPSFPHDMRVSLDCESGRYRVDERLRDGGDPHRYDGTLELPKDTYNGMVPIIAKSLPRGGEIHMVAFQPKPRVVAVRIEPEGDEEARSGDAKMRAAHYVLKPELGPVVKIVAKMLGKMPPDSHLWIATDDVPAFLRFDGPLGLDAPVWRIELASARLSR
jgi:hypothetical protein